MGVRGAKPKPTKLKMLQGTIRKGRQNQNEPKPERQILKCPVHLSREAKREWRRISGDLHVLGLLARIDRAALAAYCQAWGRWIEAEEALRMYGTMVKSPSGFPMQSPYLAVANKSLEQMRNWLTEFGMTPSSRTRVHAAPAGANEEDPVEQWLRSR